MKTKSILIAGDAIVILIMVMFGLSFHQSDAETRLLPNLLPFLAAWALAAGMLGLWNPPAWRSLWRVIPAMLLAAPLGAVLRAAWLGSMALPLFTFIIGVTLALGLVVWRAVVLIIWGRKRS